MRKFTLTLTVTSLFLILLSFNSYAQGYSYETYEIPMIDKNYDIVVYPNPVTDFKFTVKTEVKIKSVEILNVIGQSIKTLNNIHNEQNLLVEIPKCEEGVYLIKVTFTDNKTGIKKIIVK